MSIASGPWPAFRPPPPQHPRSTLSLVLGIVGVAGFFLVVLPAIVSPLAWYFGARARRDMERGPGAWGGRGAATAGMVLGVIGTALFAVILLLMLLTVAVIGFLQTYDTGYGA